MAQTGDVKFGNSNSPKFNLSLAGTGGSNLPNLNLNLQISLIQEEYYQLQDQLILIVQIVNFLFVLTLHLIPR